MLAAIQNIAKPVNSEINRNSSHRSISTPSNGISFGYSSPLKDIAKHCAYCGCEMLTETEVQQTVSRLTVYSGTKLQNEITNILKLHTNSSLTQARIDILKELLDCSYQKPYLTGHSLIKEILSSREVAFEDEIENSKPSKENIFNDLKAMQPTLPQYTKDLIDDLLTLNPSLEITILKGITVIHKKSLNEGVELPQNFIDYANNAFDKFQNLKTHKTINDARLDTPTQFLNKIITPLKVTMEHVHPHSKDGDDKTSNYLPVCSCCNGERSNIPFVEQLQRRPEIVNWIKKSLDEVKRFISNMTNPPSELKTYIPDITNTLRKESNGQINLFA